jgi:hypothetical protein
MSRPMTCQIIPVIKFAFMMAFFQEMANDNLFNIKGAMHECASLKVISIVKQLPFDTRTLNQGMPVGMLRPQGAALCHLSLTVRPFSMTSIVQELSTAPTRRERKTPGLKQKQEFYTSVEAGILSISSSTFLPQTRNSRCPGIASSLLLRL